MNHLVAALSRALKDRPLTYVDCGARGDRAPRWLFKICRNASYIGIEPDAAECNRLNVNPPHGHRYLPVCLGRVREERTFHVTRNPSCSSLLKPNRTFLRDFETLERSFEIVGEQRISTVPLDTCLSEHGIQHAHVLELDTQGSELDILQGAEAQLRSSVMAVRVEVEFAPMYESQPLFTDVDAYVRARGFHLFDMSRYRVRRTSLPNASPLRGQLLWGHATYLRDYKMVEEREGRENLACIAAAMGFLDYAAEIVDTLTAKSDVANTPAPWRSLRKHLARADTTTLERLIDRGLRWKCARPIGSVAAACARMSAAYSAVEGRRHYFSKD